MSESTNSLSSPFFKAVYSDVIPLIHVVTTADSIIDLTSFDEGM